ncbi:unnamed protein product [Rotaria sordida]|uniref:G-protein coupled receptors family 2 profile 2 domain-containing protein n=1 Tax=Rotaria sordida TaxID=392033 RepID=A0A813P813_9BILA|nr:unnamed protein product [Rotaria sordida]CAF1207633.1 unnamed protein product [Rotaria sordida]
MRIINSNISAAAIINDETVNNTESISVFILGESKPYENLDLSNNQSLVSAVIIIGVKIKDNKSSSIISLYFQVLKKNESHNDGQYSCSFFNTNISKWDTTGCTKPQYNKTYDRYECTCNHLTTFALIWSPNLANTKYLTAQDIASIIFLSISILCFIAVIIHSCTTRLLSSVISMNARNLLPLISSASTTILFIFYIALGMTVYTQTTSEKETKCFLSSSVLMFFVYFFLIFMFCTKTSIGYFSYLRFVRLFPEPSYRKLFVLLIISFFISIICTSFAVGFNSNSSYNITQLYGNKLCWFTQDMLHYFMTIPIGIFLLLNLVTIVFVAKRILNHVRNATSPHHTYERMKQFVLVLLSSAVTQGIGWLIGPILTFVNADVGNILSWFFIVFSGLEGVWTILLYIIIRSEHMDKPKRYIDGNKRMKKFLLASVKNKK